MAMIWPSPRSSRKLQMDFLDLWPSSVRSSTRVSTLEELMSELSVSPGECQVKGASDLKPPSWKSSDLSCFNTRTQQLQGALSRANFGLTRKSHLDTTEHWLPRDGPHNWARLDQNWLIPWSKEKKHLRTDLKNWIRHTNKSIRRAMSLAPTIFIPIREWAMINVIRERTSFVVRLFGFNFLLRYQTPTNTAISCYLRPFTTTPKLAT